MSYKFMSCRYVVVWYELPGMSNKQPQEERSGLQTCQKVILITKWMRLRQTKEFDNILIKHHSGTLYKKRKKKNNIRYVRYNKNI